MRERERRRERESKRELAIIPWNSIKIAKRAAGRPEPASLIVESYSQFGLWPKPETERRARARFPSAQISLSPSLPLSPSHSLSLPLSLHFISIELCILLQSRRQWNSLSSFSIGSRTRLDRPPRPTNRLWRTPKLSDLVLVLVHDIGILFLERSFNV